MFMMAEGKANDAILMSPSWGQRGLARLIAVGVRLLSWTWRVQVSGAALAPGERGPEPVVYAFWHGEQLVMVPIHSGLGIVGLASMSRDGSLLARVIELFGYRVVRGSSSRGGREALGFCVRFLKEGESVGIAVDGPRGPVHQPHAGAIVMAARTRRPIVFVVSASSPVLQLRSWDGFQVPWPFARVRLAYGELSPPKEDPAAITACQGELRQRMLAARSVLLGTGDPKV